MGRAEDLIRNRQDDEEIDRLHKFLKETIHKHFLRIDKVVENFSEEEIIELTDYIRYFAKNHGEENLSSDVSMEKIQASLLLFCKLTDVDDTNRILSYLESVEFGWHGSKYYMSNPCLRRFLYDPKGHCKKAAKISTTELATNMVGALYDIFFSDEFSQIVLLVFSYCLTSIFTSILNKGGVSASFFLQIAADKSSVAYQILKEIVEICDVNSGIDESCNRANSAYGKCNYIHQIYFPTQSTAKDIDNLMLHFKDCPVAIVGYENERNYTALLREVANIPAKNKALDLRERFNLLPVFVCPAIKSSFDNVFDIDLTGCEVSAKYLTLIKEKKQMLASWVLELVTSVEKYQSQETELIDRRRIARNRSLISSMISPYINQVCQGYPNLTLDNAKNVGFLNYFFSRYIDTIRRLCTFPDNEKFEFFESDNVPPQQDIGEIVDIIKTQSEKSLADLHHRYLPAPTAVGIKDRGAANLARQIENHYRALKVYVRVIPTEVMADRYIFKLETLNETKDVDISRTAKTVQRRLKKYEWFRVDLRNPTSINLVVAEQALTDNSLIEMLNSGDFAESKLKIPYAMGFDDTGAMCIEDIVEFPHLLLGGATKSGKSTAIMSLLMSIAYKHRTGNVNVLILDLLGKSQSDFDIFKNQPFLSAPVITEPDTARKIILLLYQERTRRMKDSNLPDMPYIVCVIDEFPRLCSGISNKEYAEQIEAAMNELLSSSRHTKIHLVLAAQNPAKRNLQGSIANITARIALKCAHYQNSVTILGRAGAEKLVGRGQMIFDSIFERDRVLQGSYISFKDMTMLLAEIEKDFKQQNKYPFKIGSLDTASDLVKRNSRLPGFTQSPPGQSYDEKLAEAIMWTLPQRQVANSRLQAKLQIGNNRANRLLGRMEEWGLIHKLHGNLGWETIPECFEDIPITVINYLNESGVTEAEIRSIFQGDSDA